MPFYVRDNEDSNWAPIALVMTVLVVALAMGYFLWYGPSRPIVQAPTRDIVVTQPAPAPSPSTTIVVPTPGPAGETGARGQSGADGADGAEGAPGRTGDPGKPDDKGSGGP